MKKDCRFRMSAALWPTLWGAHDPPAITLFERAGFDVQRDRHGPSASSFETQQQLLSEGTIDCILAPGEMLRQDLASGVSSAAVLPRLSARLGLLAPLGKLHSTPDNPTGLTPGATVTVPSLGQQCQLLALRPDLNVVKMPRDGDPRPALRNRTLDAALIPAKSIDSSRLEYFELIELGEEIMLPPPGAGTMVLVVRSGDPLGESLASLDDPKTRRCLSAELSLANGLGRPAGLADLATQEIDGSIRLQATLAGDAPDPRSALARVGAVASTPETAAKLCRFALEECLREKRGMTRRG